MSRDENSRLSDEMRRKVDELRKIGESRGFTLEYQQSTRTKENKISHKKRAPATDQRYSSAVERWQTWMMTQNEPYDRFFSVQEPDPSAQVLKLFSESYICLRKGELPTQHAVAHNLSCFIAEWERKTSRVIPKAIKKDVYNYIRNELTPKYKLETKHREKFHVTATDLDLLLKRLFQDDDHDYVHERARFQDAFALSLFSASASRAGAIVESSSYRNSNECLYYKHITFNIQYKDNKIRRWVTLAPEFIKGLRYTDEEEIPKNWIPEQKILGRNFIFLVMVAGIADQAFKGIRSVDKLLSTVPPKGRESWTLEWEDDVQDLPVLRMVTPKGPHPTRALTFSSLRHSLGSLSQRVRFRDPLRIHGIRGRAATTIDAKESEATRSQALDHTNADTYLKYQSKFKRTDIQAHYWNLEPDYDCLDIEESMNHHRDPNAPQKLDAAAIAEFENDEEIKGLYAHIERLTRMIDGKPGEHQDLADERNKLYNQVAKKRRSKTKEFIQDWWKTSYDEYIAGKDFTERDSTCLFSIFRKYMPERDRLRDRLFTEVTIDSDIGRQCLLDMVAICTSEERVAYYPGESPVNGRCPVCFKDILSFGLPYRSSHIIQCRRKSLNAAPYQQLYKNGKRAHRRADRVFLEWCFLCSKWFNTKSDWEEHCGFHLKNLQPRCGLLTFRYTLVWPGFCPFCLGGDIPPDRRFRQWRDKATLINHIDSEHLVKIDEEKPILCPHPFCEGKEFSSIMELRRHFYNVHSIEEPRRNCVTRKRKWILSEDVKEEPSLKQLCDPQSDSL